MAIVYSHVASPDSWLIFVCPGLAWTLVPMEVDWIVVPFPGMGRSERMANLQRLISR
jgi:hypothetical protein